MKVRYRKPTMKITQTNNIMNRHISDNVNHNGKSGACGTYSAPTFEATSINCESGFAISGAEGECPDIDGWNEYGEY